MKSILDLLVANRSRSTIRNEIDPGALEATVYLFSPISDWIFDPAEWCADFAAISAPTIHLRVNSPGGDVFVARTMASAIAAHPSKVIAHVDGIAASAASFLVMSAAEIEMGTGAMMMIHDPWAVCVGNSCDMRDRADVLDKIGEAICADYVARSGLDAAEVAAMMKAETWLSADDAVTKGLADRIVQTAKPKPGSTDPDAADWDLTAYSNAPRIERRAPDPFAALAADRDIAARRLRLYQRPAA